MLAPLLDGVNSRKRTRRCSIKLARGRQACGRSLALLALLALLVGVGVAQVSVKTIESVQKAVIPVGCVRLDANQNIEFTKIAGSGFFINREGQFLTAAHVMLSLDKFSKENKCSWAIFVPKTSWKSRLNDTQLRWFMFTNCRYRAGTDVAACKAIVNPFLEADVKNNVSTLSFSSFKTYGDGSAVAFTGFPLGIVFPVTSKGYIASYLPIEQKLIIDKTAWPGASGSPVYDEKGKVIGLLIERGLNDAAGLSFARPADFILNFLRENNIPTEQ
ncbi:MAG TPA: serine protease [Pyrinomonadaceae bacterium]|jgi:S1-C subfamily serine protease